MEKNMKTKTYIKKSKSEEMQRRGSIDRRIWRNYSNEKMCIIWISYQQGKFETIKEKEKFVTMIRNFNVNKSTITFKVNVAKMVNKYAKLKNSSLSFKFLKRNFKDIKEICKEIAEKFKEVKEICERFYYFLGRVYFHFGQIIEIK